jgi:hypothetical protein
MNARLTLLTMIPPRLCATKIIGRCVVCHSQCRLQPLYCLCPYLCKPSHEAKIRHQLLRMIAEVLATDAVAMSVRIVAPAEYVRIGEMVGEEVTEPVDAVARRPRLLAVSVQAMDSDDAWDGLAVKRVIG